MARTYHHKGQRINKCGLDFGAKYNVNKYYGAGSGRVPKDAAHREMRNDAKVETNFINTSDAMEEVYETLYPSCGFPDDEDCDSCGADWLEGCMCGVSKEIRVWEFK